MSRFGKSLIFLSCLSATGFGCTGKQALQDDPSFAANIARSGDPQIADVDGTKIYLSDVRESALAKGLLEEGVVLTPDHPVFQNELDELVDLRLLALEALRQSLDQNDETRRRLAAARERILANVLVEDLIAKQVTENTVKRMYDEQKILQEKGKQVRARQIVVSGEQDAREFRRLIDNGGDFAALAREYSIDLSTRGLGGDLGYFSKNGMPKAISDIAFALEKGKVSEPFRTADGWHILKVEDSRIAPRPAFDDIKADIIGYMTYEEIGKLLKSLRSNSTIVLKPDNPVPEKTDETDEP